MPACPDSPAPATAASNAPQVHTRADRRRLEFSPGNVQSEMSLAHPDALVLAYARAMMCFTLFKPAPRHILMVGLGGGSLAKFCYRYLPEAHITVLELRADVIALREQFMVPPDDARFQVIHADAVDYLRHTVNKVDVLLVDGFDAAGLPPALASARFLADCRRALRPDGLLVSNVFSYDAQYALILRRLHIIFDNRVCWFDAIAGNNHILFSVNGPLDRRSSAPSSRAMRLQQRLAGLHGLGLGALNRLLAHAVVRYLAWR